MVTTKTYSISKLDQSPRTNHNDCLHTLQPLTMNDHEWRPLQPVHHGPWQHPRSVSNAHIKPRLIFHVLIPEQNLHMQCPTILELHCYKAHREPPFIYKEQMTANSGTAGPGPLHPYSWLNCVRWTFCLWFVMAGASLKTNGLPSFNIVFCPTSHPKWHA